MRLTVAGIVLGALFGLAILADWMSPQDPTRQDLEEVTLSPGPDHPLGTDALGRDLLSRLAYGSRVSLTIAVLGTLLSVLIGTLVGLTAGVSGGTLDRVLMRFVDLMLAFPTLVLLLVLVALFRTEGIVSLVILLGVTTWMPLARLVRAEALSLGRQRFVEAAASLGATRSRRAIRHFVPNVLSTIIVSATLLAGDVILMESGLSFLGLGVAAPTPTLGSLVRVGMQDLSGSWWIATFPGLSLALAVIGFNLLGDGIRDVLSDPSSIRGARWGLRMDGPATS